MKISNLRTASVEETAYDVTYVFPAIDFGAGDAEEVIQGPADFKGVVRSVTLYDVTEIFSSVTTEARVEVGIGGGDDDTYAVSDDLGVLGVAASACPRLVTKGAIPKGASVGVNMVAPTGSPTGIATVAVTVTWFK